MQKIKDVFNSYNPLTTDDLRQISLYYEEDTGTEINDEINDEVKERAKEYCSHVDRLLKGFKISEMISEMTEDPDLYRFAEKLLQLSAYADQQDMQKLISTLLLGRNQSLLDGYLKKTQIKNGSQWTRTQKMIAVLAFVVFLPTLLIPFYIVWKYRREIELKSEQIDIDKLVESPENFDLIDRDYLKGNMPKLYDDAQNARDLCAEEEKDLSDVDRFYSNREPLDEIPNDLQVIWRELVQRSDGRGVGKPLSTKVKERLQPVIDAVEGRARNQVAPASEGGVVSIGTDTAENQVNVAIGNHKEIQQQLATLQDGLNQNGPVNQSKGPAGAEKMEKITHKKIDGAKARLAQAKAELKTLKERLDSKENNQDAEDSSQSDLDTALVTLDGYLNWIEVSEAVAAVNRPRGHRRSSTEGANSSSLRRGSKAGLFSVSSPADTTGTLNPMHRNGEPMTMTRDQVQSCGP